ncbi:TPA: hypothetical protein N0F65_002615 [Lagenidium giganteum]|uniref:Protein HGH1 homolog n=1 Tax=Lagenidium giganteum TaxID=4803 RepID=A0AAV2YXY2_9STRA|nr:TPA: hypothetical protein N0F65_002615 [Lagenidium giganteum]
MATASMSKEEASKVEELVSFLVHPRPELRKSASSYLVNMTASDQGLTQLMHLKQLDVVKALCRVVSDMRPIAEDGIKALINLTASNPEACERTLKYDLLNRVMTQLEDDEWRLKDYSMMLLANVTTTAEGARALLGYDAKTGDANVAVREMKIRKLTMLFLESEPEPEGVDKETGEANWDDEYQYVANILANITQLEEGRNFLLKHRGDTTLAAALLPQLKSPNVVRRRGVASAIRNLSFDTDNHFFLYDQLDLPTKMQELLAGPEALTADEMVGMHPSVYRLGDKKMREHDRHVRMAAVECLLLLCTTRNGRNDLRRKKVYPIVRNAHLVEADEEVSEQIYKLVDFLIRDEVGEEPDWNAIRAQAFSDEQAPAAEDKAEVEAEAEPTVTEEAPKTRKVDGSNRVIPENSLLGKPLPSELAPPKKVEEEEVDESVAANLASEIAALDVSSDEEEEDEDPGLD